MSRGSVKTCLLAAALACVAAAGCSLVAPPAFQPEGASKAIVTWRSDGNSLTAHAIFQTGANHGVRLLVSNGKTLLALARIGGAWSANGPLARNGWRGTEDAAPASLIGWLNLVEAWEGASFAPDGESDMRTSRFSVRYTRNGAELQKIELVAVATGDRFRVIF